MRSVLKVAVTFFFVANCLFVKSQTAGRPVSTAELPDVYAPSPDLLGVQQLLIICLVFLVGLLGALLLRARKKARRVSAVPNLTDPSGEEISMFYQESLVLLENLPVGIAIYDKDGRQEYINDAVARLFGVPDKEAHLAHRISIYEDPILSEKIKDVIRRGEDFETIVEYDLRTASGVSYFSTDLSHIMYIDGKMRYVKDKEGNIEKYILIINDITQQRLRELQLERSELNLKLALEAGEVDVWGYDPVKQGFYSIHGELLTHEGASLEEVSLILHEDTRKLFLSTMRSLLFGDIKEASWLERIINPSGRDYYYKTKATAVHTPTGRLETVIGSHKNITDEYYRQQELEESLFKTRLAIKTSQIAQWDYDCERQLFSTQNEPAVEHSPIVSPEDYVRAVHPEDAERVVEVIRQMDERRNREFSLDIRMKLPGDENWRYVTVDGSPLRDGDGRIVRYTGFQRNNTKFILLNEQLREKNIHLNMVLQAGDIVPIVWNTEKDCLYLLSKHDFLRSEVAETDSKGIALEEFLATLHPDDREHIRKACLDLKDGQTGNLHEECRYDPFGVYDDIYEMNYVGMDYDKYGKPLKAVGYLQKITERKKAEEQALKQRELMNGIFNQIPVPLYIKDVEGGGKYIYWNEASRQIFGEGFLKSPSAIFEEGQVRKIEELDRRVFETEEPYMDEERVRMLDGTEYETIVHKSVIRSGEQKLLLIVRWDVTKKNELERNTKILSISMDGLKAYTWYCDLRDNILRFGKEFEKMGADPSDMNSMWKFAQRIHPDHREHFITFMEDFCQKEDGDFAIEYEIDINNTGNYEWWECRGTIEMVWQDDHYYKYLYGMDINIDAHKKSELALLKNKGELDALNEQNELILNNTNSGLVYLDNEYRVQWENLSSFLPDHPMTKNYRKGVVCHCLVRGLDEPCPDCIVRKSHHSGKMEQKEISYSGVVAELTAVPIWNGAQERIGTVLKVVDITESKKAQLELEAEKHRAETANDLMKNIIDCLPCLLFIKDVARDYRHVMVNKYYCEAVGRPVEEVLDKTDYEIFPPGGEADRCRHDDLVATESPGLHIYEEETFFGGRHVVWQTTKTTIETAGGDKLLIGISLDITEKMKAYAELQEAKEKAEQSNRLKSAFLANMSHEIRTPLNAIVGFSELMMDAEDEEEKKEFSGVITANNELLLRLIGDILDLSKMEAGMMELTPTDFDVAHLFEELSLTFERRVKPEVKLVTENPYGQCVVSLDKDRFTQILTNFMTNALKFTSKGEIRMGYEYLDGGLRIYVSDTGIGIAKKHLDKVFERFEKLNNFAQGTGLGMAICKAIVDAYGGKIGVESEEGKGSTFWAWIPVEAEIGC